MHSKYPRNPGSTIGGLVGGGGTAVVLVGRERSFIAVIQLSGERESPRALGPRGKCGFLFFEIHVCFLRYPSNPV